MRRRFVENDRVVGIFTAEIVMLARIFSPFLGSPRDVPLTPDGDFHRKIDQIDLAASDGDERANKRPKLVKTPKPSGANVRTGSAAGSGPSKAQLKREKTQELQDRWKPIDAELTPPTLRDFTGQAPGPTMSHRGIPEASR